MIIRDLTALCSPANPRLRAIARIDSVIVHRIKVGHDGITVSEWFAAHPEEGIPSMPYHFLVKVDGGIDHCRPLDHLTPHAYKWNGHAIGVAFDGDFRPSDQQRGAGDKLTEQQLDSGIWLVSRLVNLIPGKRLAIYGHDENADASNRPGHICPGRNFDIDSFRSETTEMIALTAADELRHAGAKVW